jgi:hypothetical protein
MAAQLNGESVIGNPEVPDGKGGSSVQERDRSKRGVSLFSPAYQDHQETTAIS